MEFEKTLLEIFLQKGLLLAQTFKEDIVTPLLLFGNMLDYGNYDDVVNKHSNEAFGFSLVFGKEIKRYVERYIMIYLTRMIGQEEVERIYSSYSEEVVLDVWISKPDKKMVVERTVLKVDGRNVFEMTLEDQHYRLSVGAFQAKKDKRWEDISVEMGELHFSRFVPRLDEERMTERYVQQQNIGEKEKEQIFSILEEAYNLNEKNLQKSVKDADWFELYVNLIMIDSYFSGIANYLNRYAREISYVGPFRENPKRTYRDSESNYDDVGVRGENAGMLLRQDAQNNRLLLGAVSEWFQDAMGYTIDIKDIGSSLYSLVVKSDIEGETEETDNIIDVGYGISQVLPIVTELLNENGNANAEYREYMAPKKVFIMEQPELHLHPAAQAELANLLVRSANMSRSRRILVETHSEHLIRKLQVLIADPEVPIDSDQVAFYYVEKDVDGNSHIRKMDINKNGQFEKAWPSGFFDKSYELTSELLYANSKVKN